MGLFSSFFSSGANELGADTSYKELMAYGKRQLFAGKTKAAVQAFSRAAVAAQEDPLPLAYRSWAGRLEDKALAISDGSQAVGLDPRLRRGVHRAGPWPAAGGRFGKRRVAGEDKNLLADADGSVLFIGVYLVFVEAITSMREDEAGLHYEFKATPLRNAADWLLTGKYAAARAAFEKMHKSGRNLAGACGMVATFWAMGDMGSARLFAELLTASGGIKELEPGLQAAIRNIQNASQQ